MAPEIRRYPSPSEQIAGYLREQIETGELAPGDQVPGVDQITETWKVARDTANRVLRLLRDDGLVRVTHRGTYVLPPEERTTPDQEGQET